VVVEVGLTVIAPLADVEVNDPGVMARLVAPEVVQLSVLLCPELMPVGLAENDEIAGAGPGVTEEPDEPQLASPRHSSTPTRVATDARLDQQTGIISRLSLVSAAAAP